jgi:archaellum component FlaC
MTIDERIERLTERHEALAQTVELFVAEVSLYMLEMRRETRLLTQVATKLVDFGAQHEERITKLEEGR